MNNKSHPPDLVALRSGLSRVMNNIENDFGYLSGFFLKEQIVAIKRTIYRSERRNRASYRYFRHIEAIYRDNPDEVNQKKFEEAFFESVMQDSAHNLTIISLISAFMESTVVETWHRVSFTGCEMIDCKVRKRRTKILNENGKINEFWNPRIYCHQKSKTTENWVLGSDQLAKISGLDKYISDDFKRVCEALQAYRNFMLHNGLLWSDCRADKFSDNISKNKWDDWFESEAAPRIKKENCSKPAREWMFRMTPIFREKCYQSIDDFARGVATFLYHHREKGRSSSVLNQP